MSSSLQEVVQAYYGQELTGTADLKTTACCDADAVPAWLRPLLARVHPEVTGRYYGCGLVCPPLLEGCRILDLGCGAGRDVYLLSQLAGATGAVVGVDMTPEQLAVARRHQAFHAESFGFANVTFLEGRIEALEALDLEPGGFDVIVSNCVLNLSTDKAAVLAGIRRLLKPGGEFYFSDVYADRRLPEAVRSHPVLYGECLGGALYWNDFLRLARAAGFADPRLVSDRPLAITEPQLAPLVGEARFFSATYRLFAIDALEDACEDFGQSVTYRGTVEAEAERLAFDKHHLFAAGEEQRVCGNTWSMLQASRFAPHFHFRGDFRAHLGLFQGCGSALPFDETSAAPAGGCC
ncbi:methyltransferase domain-containing protein [Synechococcus sp. CCY 9618]|uniref:methyltransferase domain-containing protein n=1 Tax=Synechococcus sp. CCY 9618 TaxID=2815602 RepID=UPI001C24AACE|nr:methyltransferase domain-containing protein [Synechococcus sp. CCY 9618]